MRKLKNEKIHMTLIDPAAKSPDESAKIAKEAEMAGTDFIMVGGSTDIDERLMDQTVSAIKENTNLKVILFPGSSNMISRHADAIFFMSLLNSSDREFIVGHQVKASKFLSLLGIEKIPMAYLVFSPGMTVGRVGKANLIDSFDRETALSYSLAAQYMGFKLIYFEAGSGAPRPVSEDTISYVKSKINIPLIVGGGIRDPETAMRIALAGADMIVTGSIAEKSNNVYSVLRNIIGKIKSIEIKNSV
ncbi:hypothetical protein [Thermoplasma volcanium GSS1]|nr:hypothetical protein [Thermoplasma volcanium GSS1]